MAPPPRPTRPGTKQVQVVRALYDYTAQRADELSFSEGDVLYVLNKDEEGWWKCRCNEKEGFVPVTYVGENTAEIDNPLHEAAKRGNLGFSQELVNAGVSVNALDKAGNSPLHWASRGGHLQVVQLLLGRSPAINSQNKLGDTPLHLAAWGGHTAVLTALLAHQPAPDTKLKNNDGKTAQQLAKSDETAAALMQATGTGYAAGLVEDDDEDDD